MAEPPARSRFPLASFFQSIPYPIFAVALATAMQTGDAWVFNSISVLYTFIQEDMGLSVILPGLTTGALLLGGMGTALFGGWLADIWGVKRMVILSLIGVTVPVLGFATSVNIWMLLAMAMLIGAVSSPVYPASSRAVMDWLPPRSRGLGMGMKQTGPSIAGTLAAVSLPALATALSWRWAMVVAIAYVLLIVILVQAFYRDRPVARSSAGMIPLRALIEIMRDRAMAVTVTWASIFVGLQLIIFSYFIVFLVQEAKLSPVAAGWYMAVALVVSLAGRILWGLISDAVFGGRRVVVLGIVGFGSGGVMLATSFIDVGAPGWHIALVAAGHGMFSLSAAGILTVLISEIAGQERIGVALGGTQIFIRIGMIVIPPLFGVIVAAWGYPSAWVAAAIAAIAVTAGLAALSQRPRSA